MTDKSLRVKLVIVSLLENNLNQQISHFRSFDSTRGVNTDESFGPFTFKPDIALPYVRYLRFFHHCNFAEILFASMFLVKITGYHLFASGHRLG